MSDRRNESAEDRRVSLRQGSEHELVRTVQKRLKEAGFDPGEETRVFDTQTRKAVAEFQLQHDLDATTERLEAVVHVKRDYGYGGDICSSGTPEYVRFYVGWDRHSPWPLTSSIPRETITRT